MHRSIKAFVCKGDDHYVAECLEIAVVTQGKTLDETIANLREAVALHLEGEDPAQFPWHEVTKVAHYWLEVDTMKTPMMVRDDRSPCCKRDQ